MKSTFETLCGMSPRIHELTIDRPLYKYVNAITPAGIITSGYLGIGIWFIDGYTDECIAAWGDGEVWDHAARHCIYYSESGRAYIRKSGRRWYLDEAVLTSAA